MFCGFHPAEDENLADSHARQNSKERANAAIPWSLFRSDCIGTELQIHVLTRFLCANRSPLRSKMHYPAGWNVSARAIVHASRKRGSWVPSINSPGRSDG